MIKQAECILDLISGGLGTNTTVDDSTLSSCDDDIDVSHLILSFPEPDFHAHCQPPTEGDPQCPEVQLPEGWTGGSPVVSEELSALQVRGCGGNSDGLQPGLTASVRCCSMDGSTCQSGNNPRTYNFISGGSSHGEACAAGACNGQPDTWCHRGLTLPQAAELCEANGERLCTRAEIGSSTCCGTGCSHDGHLIWIQERAPPQLIMLGAHDSMPLDVSPGSGYDGTTAAVRCCSMDGSFCQSGDNPAYINLPDGTASRGEQCVNGACGGLPGKYCHRGLNMFQAMAVCAASGQRLCTISEMSRYNGRNLCAGTGCNHDGMNIWVTE